VVAVASLVALVGLVALAGCGSNGYSTGAPESTSAPTTITLTSPAFAGGGTIPTEFTCDGANTAPPLRWTAPPAGTDHLRLDVVDPDAPGGTFVHWRVASIPASATAVPPGTAGYRGPCPPRGAAPHHYVFTLSAVDRRGTVLGRGRLVGRYGR